MWCGGKCLSIKLKKTAYFCDKIFTMRRGGGVNQIISTLRCCELGFSDPVSGILTCGCTAFISSSYYEGIESLKIFSFEDNLLKRLSTDKGNCLMIGLWFDWLWM